MAEFHPKNWLFGIEISGIDIACSWASALSGVRAEAQLRANTFYLFKVKESKKASASGKSVLPSAAKTCV